MRKMSYISCIALCLLLPNITQASETVLKPIYALFDGMRAHDSEMILSQFQSTATLQRVNPDGSITHSDIGQFAQNIANHNAYLDEQLLNVQQASEGPLASVWTPFAFYINGKLSHCGVNHFLLIKQQDVWKISSVIDTTHQGDCEAFIRQYES